LIFKASMTSTCSLNFVARPIFLMTWTTPHTWFEKCSGAMQRWPLVGCYPSRGMPPWSRQSWSWILPRNITDEGILTLYTVFALDLLEPLRHRICTWHLLENLAKLSLLKQGLVGSLGRMEIKMHTHN
jgi:hypothetical protein